MLKYLLSLFSVDLAVDLGTANTLIYTQDSGIILREPSVVAMNTVTKRVEAVGAEAYDMVGKTPDHIKAIRPMQDGVIADFEAAERMISHFVQKALGRRRWAAPRMVVGVPLRITPVERRAVRDSVLRARASEVFLVQQPIAAAIGAGLDVTTPIGCCVVDIGGGTTDIAVISLSGIAAGTSVRAAGDMFTQGIIEHLRRAHGLLVGERTGERIKMALGNARPGMQARSMEIRGRDLSRLSPATLTVTDQDIREGLSGPLHQLLTAVANVLEKVEPELSADLVENGILLTGGGALLEGLPELLADETNLAVKVAEHPLDCVVNGAGVMLERMDLLQQVSRHDV
ncbi:MAG: rod shape-determining protein [Acidobacteria bacterium]|nr:rod shape-determining protein [Acidobacteriota bacterium]